MTVHYLLAGLTVEISSLYEKVHTLCAAYRTEEAGTPDIAVCITQPDIDLEQVKSARELALEGHPAVRYSDVYLETLAVYRQIAERMPFFDRFVFHGSVVAVDGVAYLFTAKSGTGKSTHTRLWRELLGERAVMVNDDKPILQVEKDGVFVYGTPWDGKHRLSNNIVVPLKAVCILERAEENRIREISRAEAMPMLLQQAYRPADPAALARTLQLIDRMNVKFYRLSCNMDLSAAELSYRTMSAGSVS